MTFEKGRKSKLVEELKRLDHWEVMERVIGKKVRPGQMIHSPVRQGDKHPSFGLFRDKTGQARWKDFAYDFGDLYQLIMEIHGVGFPEAIKIAASFAGITNYNIPKAVKKPSLEKVIESVRAKCSWEKRPWSAIDFLYWNEGMKITFDMLENFNVIPVESFTLISADEKKMFVEHTDRDPCYVYSIGSHGKLYRPFSKDKRKRFIGNTDRNDIFGVQQIDPSLPAILTGGQKDAMVATRWLRSTGASFNSESLIPGEQVMFNIHMNSKKLYILYDNDEAGRKFSQKICERFPFVSKLEYPDKCEHKDIADVVVAGDVRTIIYLNEQIHGNN